MTVRLSDDKTYPIIIEDSRDGVVNIHRFTLEDDDDWNEFIDRLNGLREVYLKHAAEIYKR